jgi:hypothetical protein
MPPRASTNIADQAGLVADIRVFLENERPPLSANEYEALIPRYNDGDSPYWTAQEEVDLQGQIKYAHILQMDSGLGDKEKGARHLWRLFPQVYRCLPTELFSWKYQVDVDTSNNENWKAGTGPDAGHLKPIWSANFCQTLSAFTMHEFWTYNKEWDFPVMAQLMQLAVICRKNDCRPWRLVNQTEDTFFTELANEIDRPDPPGVRTIKAIMDSVEARMNARNIRPSEFRRLCRAIVADFFKSSAGPLLAGVPGPYKVNANDLKGLVRILDRLSPNPVSSAQIWSGETWKKSMEKARGHGGHNQTKYQPLEDSDLLARAIAFGLMARERD